MTELGVLQIYKHESICMSGIVREKKVTLYHAHGVSLEQADSLRKTFLSENPHIAHCFFVWQALPVFL